MIYFISRFNVRKKLTQKKSSGERFRNKNTKRVDWKFQKPNKELIYNQHYFSNKKVLITGELYYFKTRNDLAELLWENGATIEKTFNSAVDVLIVGKSNIDSSKLKSAYFLNIKVITEEELLSYFPHYKPFSEAINTELQLN